MALATGLPLSTASVTTTAVAVVKTTAPNTTKDSNSGSNSFSIVTNTGYNLGSNLNNSVIINPILVANTKTVLPTIESIYTMSSGGDNFGSKQTAYTTYSNTKVITDVQYSLGGYSPNNYIIPVSATFVANTKTVLPTVEWLYTVGNNNQMQQYSNNRVVIDVQYNLGAQTNPLVATNIKFVANTQTMINALAIGGQVLKSVTVPTFSSNVLNFFIGTYAPSIQSVLSTKTFNDFPSDPYTIKNAYTVITDNVVVYGANTGSNAALGLTAIPAYSVTINDFPTKPYTATGSASSVTFKYFTMPQILVNNLSFNDRYALKVDSRAYANSIYLVKSGFASSVTNYYGTGGGFDPNSPYLGASTAYWS